MGIPCKYTTNLFENDLEGLSYFIGFLYSDGSVDIKNKALKFTSTDKDVIFKLKDRLNYTGPVLEYQPRGIGIKKQWCLKLHGKIYQYIISLGIINNKENHSLSKLKTSLDFFAFCRGFLDGDGHYHTSVTKFGKKLQYINFLGRKPLLLEIKNKLNCGKLTKRTKQANSKVEMYRLNVYGKDAYNLAHKLYDNASIYMSRKYDTWKECINYSGYNTYLNNDYGIYKRKENIAKCWLVDFLKNKIRYRKTFNTKEEAINWRNSILKQLNLL